MTPRKVAGGPDVATRTAEPLAAPHSSRQVAWWPVHEWVQRYLDTTPVYPWPGTPAWCDLADDDRRKWAGLLDFAQHHALRVETAQAAQAEASSDIAASTDWPQVAREVRRRSEFRRANPWARRKGAAS